MSPALPRPVPLAALALAAALASCRIFETPPPSPTVAVAIEHYLGSVLTGPQGRVPDAASEPLLDTASLDLSDAWTVRLRVSEVVQLPRGGRPLSADARMILAEGSDSPFRTRADLAVDALRVPAEAVLQAEGRLWFTDESAALFPGTTLRFACKRNGVRGGARAGADWSGFGVEVSRRAQASTELAHGEQPDAELGTTELAFTFDGVPAGNATPPRQRLVMAPSAELAGGDDWVVLLPSAVQGQPQRGYVVELRIYAEGAAGDEGQLARDGVAASARAVLESTAAPSFGAEFRVGAESALDALKRQRLQRSALVFLAQSTDATLMTEFALAAPLDQLEEFVAGLDSKFGEPTESEAAEVLGWRLEQSAYRWLLARIERIEEESGEDAPPESRALLARHAGELSHHPDLLGEILSRATNRTAFVERLVQENLIFLEDSHPAARVRAYDWLDARAAAPQDFNPLGELPDRRAALASARAQSEEQADAADTEDEGESQ